VRVVATAIVQQSISAIYHLQVYFPLNVIKLSVSCGWMGTRTSSNNGMNEGRKEGRKEGSLTPTQQFSAISWREQVNFQ
jgi:hypothetical protein